MEDRLAGDRLPGLLAPSTDSDRQTDIQVARQTGLETDGLTGSDWLNWFRVQPVLLAVIILAALAPPAVLEA